jgi:cation diffusion facilitator CzcD-associated flavoprotein CzcO
MVDSVAKELGFDFDAKQLHEKYLAERDKRLRAEGNDQYVEIAGEFAHYLEDPYVEPGFTRDPLKDDMEVVIVGGGFAGLQAGARLREAGVKDIRIIERGGDFGGTWYWNRYPGAACDVESYIYLPLLEETGYMPTRKYARSPEIYAHAQRIGKFFDLYKDACFQTELTDMRWDEARARWVIKTNHGDEMTARFVVMGSGPLNRPKLPGIPGLTTFKGHTFHTSRWDYAYTGGGSEGNLTGLNDKRVAIIGTGATAVQAIPHLAESAKQLFVFQRTPSSIDVRNDYLTDPKWAASLPSGWQKRRMNNFDMLISGVPQDEDLVADGWTDIFRTVFTLAKEKGAGAAAMDAEELRQLADFKKMEQIRARVDAVVEDPKLAAVLKPYYNQFCKRPCFHDEYLKAYNRANVTLVDTNGRGVEQITEKGVMFDGVEYEVDCIIFATGFEVGTAYTHRGNFEAHGRGGRTLTDKWSGGPRSLHGIMTRDFPNYFLIGAAQSAVTVNIPYIMDEQSKHIAAIVKRCLDLQVRAIDVTEEAEEAWQQEMRAKSVVSEKFFRECTPGYYNNEGQGDITQFFSKFYGGGPFSYMQIMSDWRDGAFERDLEISYE